MPYRSWAGRLVIWFRGDTRCNSANLQTAQSGDLAGCRAEPEPADRSDAEADAARRRHDAGAAGLADEGQYDHHEPAFLLLPAGAVVRSEGHGGQRLRADAVGG